MHNNERAKNLQLRLKLFRTRYKSDTEFAQVFGVKLSTMYKWLKGNPPVWPDEPNLRVIAGLLGCSIEELGAPLDSAGRVKETAPVNSLPTYEAVIAMIDRLPDAEKKRVIAYTALNIG